MRKIILISLIFYTGLGYLKAQCFNAVSAGWHATIALKSDSTIWGCGYNFYGQLGNGTSISSDTFIKIGNDNHWKTIQTNTYRTYGIKSDGTLWGWGENPFGYLGDGTSTNKYVPIQIGSANDWEKISLGNKHVLALKKDGTLWGWGENSYGQLGDGSTQNKNLPTKIGTTNDWKNIYADRFFSIAQKKDGTLWGWGYNYYGQLGDSTFIDKYSPVQIGLFNDWVSIVVGEIHCLAIRSDGSLWSWGDNFYGELGDGKLSLSRNYPMRIGTANNWRSVYGGGYHSFAIKTDSTLWAWGENANGTLGDGTIIDKYFPVQIGSAHDWKIIDAGLIHTCGIKFNGTLFSWGYNASGPLGDGTTIDKHIPTYISCPGVQKSPDHVSGAVFIANNNNCSLDSGETGLPNILVLLKNKEFGTFTDNEGKFRITCDSGVYNISPTYPSYLKPFISTAYCPPTGSYSINLDVLDKDISGLNFAQDFIRFPLLKVELSQSRLRRCFDNSGIIKYCNLGTHDTDNVKIIVTLPDNISLVSASLIPLVSGNTITFNIGKLKAGECGTINLVTHVDCINGLTGLTRCFKVRITPANKTYKNLLMKPGYDKSKIIAGGKCFGSIIKFTLTNEGEDMFDSSSYRIFQDTYLGHIGKFKLKANESLSFGIIATGHTYRIEADQAPGYPTNSNPNASVENCGPDCALHLGFITKQPPYEENSEYKELCIIIRDSYDPNEKSVFPSGIGSDNIVQHKVRLHYTIQFQNTGNDTAYKVVVRDTLSKKLDLSTLLIEGASHPYTVEFNGKNATVINFIFDSIYLVDNNTNEKKSHGSISYSIIPYDTIPVGTTIKNRAYIYFDFNTPVQTNTTSLTIDESTPPSDSPVSISGIHLQTKNSFTIDISPNPATNQLSIVNSIFPLNAIPYSIYNSLGQIILTGELKDKVTTVDINSLSNGIYFLSINNKTEKFVVIK